MAGRTPRTPTITPSLPLPTVHNYASAIPGAVKNAQEAKAYLFSIGWCLPGEVVALDTLARTLFSVVVDGKLPSKHANAISAVAFLLTERLEEKIIQGFTDKIADLAKTTVEALTVDLHDRFEQQIQSTSETFQAHTALTENLTTLTENLQQSQERFTNETLTSDLHSRLEQQIQTITETAQAQSALTENLQQAQVRLENTTQQVVANARTYSQVTASPPNANNTHSAPQVSLAQVQLRNREEIKKKQVLIDFDKTADLDLNYMDQDTLARKVNDAVNTAWAITPEPRPSRPKIRASTLMRNGGLLIEFDTEASADWLKGDEVSRTFLENVGSGARIKNRSYQVIVQFAPIQFSPSDDAQIRQYENTNGLEPNSVLRAEWIKNPLDRKPGQKVATLRMYHKNAKSANTVLNSGAFILGKKIVPKKPKKEPIRCLKCQKFGHERRDCKSENPRCGKCSNHHETDECEATKDMFRCANCLGPHPSYDRECAKFWEKCRQIDSRCPENNLAFYPTDDPWSWATLEQDVCADPPPANHLPPPPGRNTGLYQTTLTGANRTNLGPHTNRQQSHFGMFQ